MSIKRMLLLGSMALTAIAFAAPAVAQANVTLTEPKGTLVKVKDAITITSTDLVTTVGPNIHLECNLVTLHYKVGVNNHKEVRLDPVIVAPATHNGTTEGCVVRTTIPEKPDVIDPTVISAAGTQAVKIDTWGTANVQSTFTNANGCVYAGLVHIVGKANDTDEVNIGPSNLAGDPITCGTLTTAGTGTIERSNGKAAFLDFTKTP